MTVKKSEVKQAVEMFPWRLAKAREAVGLTQVEVARDGQFSPTAISHFESGRRTPSLANLFKLCRVLHCKADKLLSLHWDND